ncbi:SusD/RagB family nutrient-binding outer membrane lipoprotein [Compostibacter hankyongensis]|uniref:SusD/RagB family nutrient-binding outer membrane lipoprotein n=1 Tax=Compostibacter hankyongensis TaxID=1007089 RepID=A0ABP8FJC2_9BACT
MLYLGKYYRSAILMTGTVLLLGACTKDFDKINTDHTKLKDVDKQQVPYLFSFAEAASSNKGSSYQTAQNLFADLYAQYYATTSTGFQTDRYSIRYDWLDIGWRNVYTQVAPQLRAVLENTDTSSTENALARIVWVFAFHRLTDYYGPVPYFMAGMDTTVVYDPQDKIYDDFFKQLTGAVEILKKNGGESLYGDYDLIYSGDVAKWIKFANTLRLRLALRISAVDPARAKKEAEAAVRDGVLTDIADDAYMYKTLDGTDVNGLAYIAVWNEFSMSSTMLSYLKGFDDPRLENYFQPAVKTGKYASLRNGQENTDLNKDANTPAYTSQIGKSWITWDGSTWIPDNTRHMDIMHAAEAYFLRAEGALNGWEMDGNAQELYEKGIETSLKQWGVTDAAKISSYISSTQKPAAPDDYQQSPPVDPAITVKWAQDEATERAQIGLQKWLALYPDGLEAWAEVRRSGYPRQYPVVKSDNADLPQGFIKRVPYPTVEQQNDANALKQGQSLLNGPDNIATPLWWDKD